MKHVNEYIRKHVPSDKSHLRTMDGHSSRKRIKLVVECEKNLSLPVMKPGNTSHILQPCDRKINKTFKESLRHIWDAFNRSAVPERRTLRFNAFCAAYICSRNHNTTRHQRFFPVFRNVPVLSIIRRNLQSYQKERMIAFQAKAFFSFLVIVQYAAPLEGQRGMWEGAFHFWRIVLRRALEVQNNIDIVQTEDVVAT